MVYFYFGDDLYALEAKLQVFRERYVAKFPSGLNFWRLDLQEDLERLRGIVETHSMFQEKKLVFVSGAADLKTEEWESVEETIKKNNLKKSEEVVIVFYEKKGTDKIDKRKKAFAYLKKEAKTEEFKVPTGARLLSWVENEVKKRGGNIAHDATRELVERTGPDTLRLAHEIEKLILYKNGGAISKADIEELVGRKIDPNVFETLDSLARRDVAAAIRSLKEHLEKGEDPVQLLSMFAYEVRTLLLVKEASTEKTTAAAVAKNLKIHPYVAQKTLGFVRNFSLKELIELHHGLAEADIAVKAGRKEPELALEDFIYSFGKP